MMINTMMQRKESCFNPSKCRVEKVIRLSDLEYDRFAGNMLDNQDFIIENNDLMHRTGDGVWHCLLVVGETRPDGILVEAEGSNYARYTALVPNARDLMMLENLPPDMRRALELAPVMVDWMMSQAADGQNALSISLPELEDRFDIDISLNPVVQDIVGHVLSERPYTLDVGFGDDTLDFTFDLRTIENTPQPGEMEMKP